VLARAGARRQGTPLLAPHAPRGDGTPRARTARVTLGWAFGGEGHWELRGRATRLSTGEGVAWSHVAHSSGVRQCLCHTAWPNVAAPRLAWAREG
jgi:hypothetical protein